MADNVERIRKEDKALKARQAKVKGEAEKGASVFSFRGLLKRAEAARKRKKKRDKERKKKEGI